MNVRQQRFLNLVVSGETAGAAYLAVYQCKPSTAETEGPALLRKPQMAAEVKRRTAKAAEKAVLSKARVLTDLDRRGAKAEGLGQLSAAIRASELQGKELGMFAERHVLAFVTDGQLDLVPVGAQPVQDRPSRRQANPSLEACSLWLSSY